MDKQSSVSADSFRLQISLCLFSLLMVGVVWELRIGDVIICGFHSLVHIEFQHKDNEGAELS